jgi:hypothetical protein
MEVYVTLTIMRTLIFFAFSLFTLVTSGQTSFEKYFTDKVLRFDFMLAETVTNRRLSCRDEGRTILPDRMRILSILLMI